MSNEIIQLQEELAEKHKYKKLPSDLSIEVKQKYLDSLPIEIASITDNENTPLFTQEGTRICSGWKRIVIGDYGAFIEIDPKQIDLEKLCIKKDQEYRLTPRFLKNIKYLWLTVKDSSDIKIYLQTKPVSYADYKPDMYYISPYEVSLKGK